MDSTLSLTRSELWWWVSKKDGRVSCFAKDRTAPVKKNFIMFNIEDIKFFAQHIRQFLKNKDRTLRIREGKFAVTFTAEPHGGYRLELHT